MTKKLRDYWEERAFKQAYASLPAVGDISWGLEINKYWYQEQMDQLEKLKIDWKEKKVLDAGCGIGLFSKYFEDAGAEVVGVDFSENMINVAKKLCQSAMFVSGDLTKLPFNDESFDVIYSSSVLIHIVDDNEWKKAISELKRCIKMGGVLIFIQEFRNFYPKNNEIDYCRLRSEIQYEKKLQMEKVYDKRFLFFIQHFGSYLRIVYKICIGLLYFLDKHISFGRERIAVYKKK